MTAKIQLTVEPSDIGGYVICLRTPDGVESRSLPYSSLAEAVETCELMVEDMQHIEGVRISDIERSGTAIV